MDILQALFLAFAGSLPLVTLAAIARGVVCIYRTSKAANWPFAVLGVVVVVLMLLVFGAVAVVWFIYAVSHGPKDRASDLVLLGGSGLAIYVGAAGAWAFSRYAESGRRPGA